MKDGMARWRAAQAATPSAPHSHCLRENRGGGEKNTKQKGKRNHPHDTEKAYYFSFCCSCNDFLILLIVAMSRNNTFKVNVLISHTLFTPVILVK